MAVHAIASIDKDSSKICITIPHIPDQDISLWVKSVERRKRITITYHARTIALRLAEGISSELCTALRYRHGLEANIAHFMPRIDYLTNDPKGIHDAYVFVSRPAFLEENWQSLYELVLREAKYIAAGHHGRVLISYNCSGSPAR